MKELLDVLNNLNKLRETPLLEYTYSGKDIISFFIKQEDKEGTHYLKGTWDKNGLY